MTRYLLLVAQLLFSLQAFSQNYQWHNPAEEQIPLIQGRGWQQELAHPYDRLPAKAEQTVRKEVWALAQHTAGEYISFRTNATKIVVRYQTKNYRSEPNWAATGMSGVDLYALDANDQWHWARGSFSFGDTVTYQFDNLIASTPVKEFRLYLPLQNTPRWLQLGIPDDKSLSFIPVKNEKPLVLYGTSIMQGACASRAGVAWTNILGRRINLPVINLGFSGNGRLEPELIDLLNEQDAKLFVLDCQPNLHDRKIYTAAEIEKRIRASVKSLQQKHTGTPILLTEHCSASYAVSMDTAIVNKYKWTSDILNKTFYALKKEGTKNIYLLTTAEIGLNAESTIDGTHPTDGGMLKYADAYEKKIREILKLQTSLK